MQLYLVQHGDALAKNVDPERPLSVKGRRDVARLAEELARPRLLVKRIFHSGKLRAQETAEMLSVAFSECQSPERHPGLGPNDPVTTFVHEIENLRNDVVVVGHLPFISKLVGALVAGDEDARIVAFEPGSMVCVERHNERTWRIVWMLQPDTFG